MTDDKTQPNMNDPPEQAKSEQGSQQAPQSQMSEAVQPAQRAAPGRKPLFRN